MKRTTRNEASFSDLFHWAEKEFGHTWNACCDLFHRAEFLTYKSFDDFELEELEAEEADDLEDDPDAADLCGFFTARRVMIAYMKHHNVKKCRIYS